MLKKMSTDAGSDTSTPVSTTQRVVHDLRHRIIRGDIAPGERLKVDSLKSLLAAGASPIREALSLLTSDQLVERIDQRGFRAAPASEKHFREILMLRCQLDDIALRTSIADGGADWEEQLVLVHHRLSRQDRDQDYEQGHDDTDAWELLHKEFHMALLQACGSPILLKFCDQLYDLNIRYRFLAGLSVRYGKRNVAQEHSDILAAVLARDAELASCKLIDHYSRTGEFLADQLLDSGVSTKSKSTRE